jgi:hypothetical protein
MRKFIIGVCFLTTILVRYTNINFQLEKSLKITLIVYLLLVVLKPLKQIISISGSDFDDIFYLSQFHFHWGFNDYQGCFSII